MQVWDEVVQTHKQNKRKNKREREREREMGVGSHGETWRMKLCGKRVGGFACFRGKRGERGGGGNSR